MFENWLGGIEVYEQKVDRSSIRTERDRRSAQQWNRAGLRAICVIRCRRRNKILCFDIFIASWMEILSEVQMHQTSVKGVGTDIICRSAHLCTVQTKDTQFVGEICRRMACTINCVAVLVNPLVRFKRNCASSRGNGRAFALPGFYRHSHNILISTWEQKT
jgi:hypothetical protein